jgi:signal transduction histidine kinase
VRLSRGRLWALGLAAALFGVALVPLIATAEFASDHGLWIALDLVIGFGFAGVGLFAWYRRPYNRVGPLMVLTAFAWYVSILERTEPPLLFTIGLLLENLFVATAIHLVLAFPTGRLERTVDRVLVVIGYVTTTLGFAIFTVFFDPAASGCASCPDNLLLIDSRPGFAMSWVDVLSVIGILLTPAVIARLVQRWREASTPLRRIVTPVFVAGAALEAILAVALAMSLFDVGSHRLKEAVYYSALIPFGLVPYLFLAVLVKGRMMRGLGLGALIRRLGAGTGPGELRSALADALGDPSVELAYWLPESGQYVDVEGRPAMLPGPGAARAVTEVERDGRRIAAIVHDPTLLDYPEQVRSVGAAAALALANERLEAELRAKVEELRASRTRLVDVGLRQRRRLERDLHDGAQQRLVSLALTLRLAQEKLDGAPRDTQRLLERSREELEQALKELRELARGIHPAVLSDRGLGAAVEAIAHRAPLPVEVGELPDERFPEHVELAAYFVISEALTNIAKYAGASHANVAVIKNNGSLMVEVADDGVGGADVEAGSGLRGLAARLESIEGRLVVDSEPGGGTTVRASIPCA